MMNFRRHDLQIFTQFLRKKIVETVTMVENSNFLRSRAVDPIRIRMDPGE